MGKADIEKCPFCDRAMTIHKFVLNQAHAVMLIEAMRQVNSFAPFHIKKVTRTRDQYTNFSHLAYWNLIETATPPKPEKKQGWWRFTPKAEAFVYGMAVPKWLKRFNRKTIEISTETVRIHELVGYFDPKEIWIERSEPYSLLQ